ncbi:MAG: hypothetical protein ACYYK0_01425, partial [Candidatus Eutrophobiaceae bacterium]
MQKYYICRSMDKKRTRRRTILFSSVALACIVSIIPAWHSFQNRTAIEQSASASSTTSSTP